jgi:hypothetical protein
MRRAMTTVITVAVFAGTITAVDKASVQIGGRREAAEFRPRVFVIDCDFEADANVADQNHCQNELLHN